MRKFALVLLVLLLRCGVASSQPYGLDSRASMGAFLGGRLPPGPPTAAGGWTTVPAFPNLTFPDPVCLTHAPRGNRIYVCCRQGFIYSFENNGNTTNKTLFLDIHARTQGWNDCGLLSIAFHPEFGLAGSTNRGYFYVWYQFSENPTTGPTYPQIWSFNRLSRFTVPDGSLAADPNSELVLIHQFDENLWHNGGAMFFGDDGFLYFTNGDEGGSNDAYNNTQKINSGLFSGVFRIDVNSNPSRSHPIRRQPSSGGSNLPASYSANYYIPNDNPFLDPNGGLLEEFYALGVRSPHSMSYDSVSQRIIHADVGQQSREEINLIERGGNYQWAFKEGTINGPKSQPATLIGTNRPPLYDYGRGAGDSCVIGGHIYRGSEHAADLGGKYIFGDNTSGRIWAMTLDGTNAPTVQYLCNMPAGSVYYDGLSAIGTDQNKELFFCKMGTNGQIFKLARTTLLNPAPLLLSQTGVFTNLATMAATNGLIPYDVNSPLWSDAAVKRRWIALPNDGAPYSVNEKAGFAASGSWTFPTGTVFVKHFEMITNELAPAQVKRLETRFLVRGTNGGVYGLTYKWRSDHSDADLLNGSFLETFTVQTTTGTRTQSWYYPSRTDCLTCHNPNASYVLGVNTRQLNGAFFYSATGRTDNQLRTWNHVGLFEPALDEGAIPGYASLVAVTNSSASLVHRVRSYLDANCAHCHRPGGVNAYFDARFDTPLSEQALIGGAVHDPLGITNAAVVRPGSVLQSILYRRMNSVESIRMPPLARELIDAGAIAAVGAWINSLTNPPSLGIQGSAAELYLSVHGQAGMTYTLEGTTNFVFWSAVGDVQDGALTPVSSESFPHQFYRLRIVP